MHLRALPDAIRQLKEAARLRLPDDSLLREQLQREWGENFIDAARNDYLGLAGSSPAGVSRETSAGPPTPGSPSAGSSTPGAGASRLIFGTAPEHLRVEEAVALWLGMPAALLFSSGYAANLGALSALLSSEDAVFSDKLNHASLIDGMRLARVRPRVFEHLDLEELEQGLEQASAAPARWVVVESYYSMDGDGPDLIRLRELCDRYDACLYVDEAHSVGTFGPAGAGLCHRAGIRADVLVAAFGKAVGSHGACVLGSPEVRTWLWNRARSFVFSTAPSPAHAAQLAVQIAATRAAHGARDRLQLLSQRVRQNLAEQGAPIVAGSFGPVLSLVCGSESAALSLAERLRAAGVLAQAIRPPTVPDDGSRVRLILSASLTDSQCQRLLEIVARETFPTRDCAKVNNA